jgi:phage FluMu protein Com
MPIRFRCHYCNQLLGIARRKAGMGVRCPTCNTQLIVPQTDTEPSQGQAGGVGPPLFERSDFERYLRPPSAEVPIPHGSSQRSGAPPAPPPIPHRAPAVASAFDVERVGASAPSVLQPGVLVPPPGGIVLSPARATLLTVTAIILLAVAFGAGLLVGRYLL